MASNLRTDREYNRWLAELKNKIRSSQLRAALKVNAEMLALYWELGHEIAEKQAHSDWGDKVITQLAADLSAEFKEIKGFSRSNLFNIRKWYLFYSSGLKLVQHPVGLIGEAKKQQDNEIVQHGVGLFPAQLGTVPWGHHIQIITKSKSIQEALFYLQQTVSHNWKRTVLEYQVESGLYHRKGKAYNNFEMALPKPQSELASELLKNPYNLDFLSLGEEATERNLENAIITNIKTFLLELGVGFSFLGQQYHLKVGEKDYRIDLLFYHTRLHCYFVIELKVTEFEPEHAGKLEFYIEAVDKQIKMQNDNPTIGLLLCKSMDNVTVEYTLNTKRKPIGIAEYRHTATIPKEWEKELPDVEMLKQELKKKVIIPKKPADEKTDKLKGLIQKMKEDEVIPQKKPGKTKKK